MGLLRTLSACLATTFLATAALSGACASGLLHPPVALAKAAFTSMEASGVAFGGALLAVGAARARDAFAGARRRS